MIGDFVSRQFVIFLITGGLAALVNFGSRYGYNLYVSYSSAIILAYITGMITAYILARLFVFKETETGVTKSAFYFVLVNIFAVAQTWGISMGLTLYVFPNIGVESYAPDIAHGIGVLVPAFTSFLGHKYLSFRT